jgi:hypothetical protein
MAFFNSKSFKPHPQPPDNRDWHSPEREGRPTAQATAAASALAFSFFRACPDFSGGSQRVLE